MTNEKLVSLKAAAEYLGISESRLKELTEYGIIPAYRVAGIYLRFKRSQLSKFKDKMQLLQAQYSKYQQIRSSNSEAFNYSLGDKIKDFWHFYDFYIISAVIIIIILFLIFRLTVS